MSVLVVDDDESIARMMGRVIERLGYEALVECVASVAVAIHLYNPDVTVVVTDFQMPKMNGIELLHEFQEARPEVKRVLVTASRNDEDVMEALLEGTVQRVISKPSTMADFEAALV